MTVHAGRLPSACPLLGFTIQHGYVEMTLDGPRDVMHEFTSGFFFVACAMAGGLEHMKQTEWEKGYDQGRMEAEAGEDL